MRVQKQWHKRVRRARRRVATRSSCTAPVNHSMRSGAPSTSATASPPSWLKNLLQTQSIAWAQGVRVALEAEGIRAVILDEHDRGALGVLGGVGVAIVYDDDLARAQAVVERLRPARTGPPPSWRWQKRGLLLLLFDVLVFRVGVGLLDDFEVTSLIVAVAPFP